MTVWYWVWRVRGKEPPECFGCGGALADRVLPIVLARAGSFEIDVRRLPYRGCESGCGDRRTAVPGFSRLTRDAVLSGALPVARRAGASDWQCGRCSSRHWSPIRRLATVEGEVRLDGVPPFTLAITGPSAICGSCGAVQIRTTPGVSRELTAILEEAWRAAGLRSGFRMPHGGLLSVIRRIGGGNGG